MNPETTPADGQFHWDVISDYYKVVASAPGCHAPGQAGQPTVSTPVLPVPPPWTGLDLVLQCAHETAPVPPSITSLSDNVAPSVGGTQVEINGSGFMPSAKVWFGLTPSPAVSYVSPSLLVAAVPPGHGAVHVLVVTAGGRTPASSANYLTYGTSPAITGVSPASGPLAGGTQVRVRGSGLAGTELVTVGHSIVTDFSVGTNGDITLTMPAGSLGTVDVGVVTAVGTSAPTPADRFSYVVPPPWVGPGQQAPSSQIPWSRVGPGWTLAIASSQAASSATLFVVDPAGGRYRVTSSVPLDGSIAGWSGDKTSALIVASVGGATTAVIEVDLKSGKIHRFLDYPSDIDSFTYSLSSPPALLEVVSKASGQYALRRANLDGATKLTYPSEFLVSFQDGHHRARGPGSGRDNLLPGDVPPEPGRQRDRHGPGCWASRRFERWEDRAGAQLTDVPKLFPAAVVATRSSPGLLLGPERRTAPVLADARFGRRSYSSGPDREHDPRLESGWHPLRPGRPELPVGR